MQHQSPHSDHMLSPTHSIPGSQVPNSPGGPGPRPPHDPRLQAQNQHQGQGFSHGQRQNAGQIPGQDWDRQGPPGSSQYPSRGQNYPRGAQGGDEYQQQQQPQHDHMHASSNEQASVRYGRGGGHVSGAKAILLPGPPHVAMHGAGLGQPGRGRSRGRSDGPRGRGRNLRGRG